MQSTSSVNRSSSTWWDYVPTPAKVVKLIFYRAKDLLVLSLFLQAQAMAFASSATSPSLKGAVSRDFNNSLPFPTPPPGNSTYIPPGLPPTPPFVLPCGTPEELALMQTPVYKTDADGAFTVKVSTTGRVVQLDSAQIQAAGNNP
jgi:hypothetical protein